MSAHTEGPWHAWFDPFSETWRIDHKLPDNSIIVCLGVGKEVDANLIAAAPDLLRELQHAVRWFDQITPGDVARYKAAIAKAQA